MTATMVASVDYRACREHADPGGPEARDLLRKRAAEHNRTHTDTRQFVRDESERYETEGVWKMSFVLYEEPVSVWFKLGRLARRFFSGLLRI